MACTREHPCGGILTVDYQTLLDSYNAGFPRPVVIHRCLNAHTFRDGPMPAYAPNRVAHVLKKVKVVKKPRTCEVCGEPLEGKGHRLYCDDCRQAQKKLAAEAGSKWPMWGKTPAFPGRQVFKRAEEEKLA